MEIRHGRFHVEAYLEFTEYLSKTIRYKYQPDEIFKIAMVLRWNLAIFDDCCWKNFYLRYIYLTRLKSTLFKNVGKMKVSIQKSIITVLENTYDLDLYLLNDYFHFYPTPLWFKSAYSHQFNMSRVCSSQFIRFWWSRFALMWKRCQTMEVSIQSVDIVRSQLTPPTNHPLSSVENRNSYSRSSTSFKSNEV